MQPIQPLDFIDVSNMTAALLMRHATHFTADTRRQDAPDSPHRDTQTIVLRGPIGYEDTGPDEIRALWQENVPHADTPLLEKWATARHVLARIAESHKRRSGRDAEFGKAMVVSLKAGGVVQWHVDQGSYAETHDRFHVCLVPSAGAVNFAGGMAVQLLPGVFTYLNNRIPHSAINLGSNDRVHLIVDIRKPEVETVQ